MNQSMRKVILLAGAALVGGALLPASVSAQGAPQTVSIINVDVLKVSTGHRASKIIGSNVVNEANETIGRVDDVIVGDDGQVPYAVISVGGFLGMGDRLVVVPFKSLQMTDKTTLPGATKDALKMRPEFKYAK